MEVTMEKQADSAKTLGQVIDELIGALSALEESARVIAIRAVCDILKIRPPEILETRPQIPAGGTVHLGITPVSGVADIKALRDEKKPTSKNEMAAVVAYYLSELAPQSERKSEVDQNDMIKYFKQARYPLPKQPRVLLQNAKNAGYFDFIGEGTYRLNPVGYNLVAHNLPKAISAVPVQKSQSRKKRAKSKKIKK
jgi:hypothetical protein